ncbi:MAG: PQQ-binding-like beta-propeller repeat protein [Candidatus Hinthialibacter antarcticus]|nr:PQQ-binding-like beta-propeller repeat protein [Candidatus Hinthialibacter antarcticus]
MKFWPFGAMSVVMMLASFNVAHAIDMDYGPYVIFRTPSSVDVYWQSAAPCASELQLSLDDAAIETISISQPTLAHQVRIENLKPGKTYDYKIVLHGETDNPVFEFNFENSLNYSVYPIDDLAHDVPVQFERAETAAQAKDILALSGVDRGYCLVYGMTNGALAYQLAKQSQVMIIGVDDDSARIQSIREQLVKTGVYGSRISIVETESLGVLPMTSRYANLIVSERMLEEDDNTASLSELLRVLRPFGGAAVVPKESKIAADLQQVRLSDEVRVLNNDEWVVLKKSAQPGAGSWTHQYANPGNTSNGNDSLEGARGVGEMSMQWIGRPGADFGIDRNPRMPAPLSINGRLFHQGMNRFAAIDSYNGSILWSIEIPHMRRVNVPRDSSNWCADADSVFVVVNDLTWRLRASDGALRQTYSMPKASVDEEHDWGFLANDGGVLFGTSVIQGSQYGDYWGNSSWYDSVEGVGAGKVCGERFFARSVEDGSLLWEYPGGKIIHTSISIGDGTVYFVESRFAPLKGSKNSRIESEDLWKEQFLVALDAKTGAVKWQRPLDTEDGLAVFFMLYHEGSLYINSSKSGTYYLYGFDANNGEQRWANQHEWPSDNHGGHMQHPVIAGGQMYQEPRGYDLKTGQLTVTNMGRHSGCATYAGAKDAFVYRGDGGQISMWNRESGDVSSWLNLRPSCWLSVIPSDGLVLAPEGGGGCSCGAWLETSLGFIPNISLKSE